MFDFMISRKKRRKKERREKVARDEPIFLIFAFLWRLGARRELMLETIQPKRRP